MVDPAERRSRHPHVEGEQDVGLEAADALGHQGGDVPVAAVLAQQRGGVEEAGHRLLGQGERPQRGVHGAALERGAGRCPGEQLDGSREVRRVDEVAEDPAQRVDAALLAGGDRRLRRGRAPDLRDVAGHLTRGEVVEERVDDLGGHRAAERGGPAGEVGVPVVGEPQGEHRLVGLVGRVGDDPDRLDELEHPASQRAHGVLLQSGIGFAVSTSQADRSHRIVAIVPGRPLALGYRRCDYSLGRFPNYGATHGTSAAGRRRRRPRERLSRVDDGPPVVRRARLRPGVGRRQGQPAGLPPG